MKITFTGPVPMAFRLDEEGEQVWTAHLEPDDTVDLAPAWARRLVARGDFTADEPWPAGESPEEVAAAEVAAAEAAAKEAEAQQPAEEPIPPESSSTPASPPPPVTSGKSSAMAKAEADVKAADDELTAAQTDLPPAGQ